MGLVEQAPCGLVLTAVDGTLLFANPTFLAMVGVTTVLPATIRFQDMLSTGGRIFYETQFAPTLLMRGSLKEMSFDLVTPSRGRVPVLINAVLRPGDGAGTPSILLAILEATERRLYESELLKTRKNSEQIAEVVRRSSDAILRIGADSTIQSWNSGAAQIFGFSPEEAIGQPLALLFFRDHASRDIEDALTTLKRGTEVNRELPGVHKSGAPVELSVSLTPHMEAPGILVAYSAVIRNITTRKLAERALLQNEKLASVGRLASSIAHEINNPLESVTNLLYILQSRVDDPETSSLVTLAQEELARVAQIATQTLRFHKQSSKRTHLDLRALADSVLGLYRARLRDSGIAAVNQSDTVSPLYCFEGELRQVLVNLVSNAFDAMRAGGRLTLRSRNVTLWSTGQSGIRITVADTGTGINEHALKHLFEPFFSTKGIGGTGLGLWITKDLLAKNQGNIRIRSSTRKAATGTVVTLTFPNAAR